MVTYEQVDAYMQEVGLKHVKTTNEFLTGLAIRAGKDYTTEIAAELNARATGQYGSNAIFYNIKNKSFEGSIYVSAAFDGGLFRHLGNLIIDNPELFQGEVIDMACDCGIVTCFIAKMYPQCHITGVDINKLAVDNARTLAQKLGLENVDFVCSDVYEFTAENKADTVCSFRGLLDVANAETKGLPFFGERQWREKQYQQAFSKYAKAMGDNLKDDGCVLTVERYTAEYGLIGWMDALADQGINPLSDKCCEMRASDLSSVKDYSVTFAKRGQNMLNCVDTVNEVLVKNFKSGTGYDGRMAEFALYYDRDGAISFTDIYNNEGKLLHQFAIATAKSGKVITYEASGNKKRIKYSNPKKREMLEKDIDEKTAVYDPEQFKIEKYEIN